MAEVGSTAHGIDVGDPDNDDLDLTVVRIEHWKELITGSSKRQSMMIRTQPEGVRSRMGDIDLNVYTLRKFAGLASKGNPSILGALFSPTQWGPHYTSPPDWDKLAAKVASKKAGDAFLGYMTQQLGRWKGDGSKRVNRPELVEQHGYDTKYAGHVLRLGHQGVEYMKTGRFSMPLKRFQREYIQQVRLGTVPEDYALSSARRVRDKLNEAIEDSPLPPQPAPLEEWLSDYYRRWHVR